MVFVVDAILQTSIEVCLICQQLLCQDMLESIFLPQSFDCNQYSFLLLHILNDTEHTITFEFLLDCG